MISKHFNNHYGIDLKSSDLDRPENYASDLLNAQYKKNGDTEKRKGNRAVSAQGGGHGLFTYNRIDPDTGLQSDILLTASNTIKKMSEVTFTITYSGAEATALAILYFDEDSTTYKLQLIAGTSIVLEEDLGLGYDEASPTTLAQLKTAVDAVTDFAATIVGTTSLPAAFLSFLNHDLIASDAVATMYEFTDVNTTTSNPLAGSETNKNASDFENVSFAQLDNIVYIANGYNDTLKYDGQTLYAAGLPNPSAPSTAAVGAGSISAGTYIHKILYKQIDAVGNIIYSDPSPQDSITLGGADDIDVTVNNVLAGTGFNTNCAVVAGAQAGVNTITVDDGAGGAHTMKAGDKAYFYDSISAGYVTRNVTSVASGTITVSGSAVTVADNAVISNNLMIVIARSQDSGSFIYEVATIPNNSFTATQVYRDSTTDANLGVQVVEPLRARTKPPKGKYLATFYNKLLIAGDPDNRNTFYWSDEKPEYFPIGSNSEVAQSKNGDPISGISQANEVLVVFENKATHVYSGDFTNLNVRHDIVSHRIGCVAHATIQQVESELFFLSEKGIYSTVSGQIPVPRANLIQPLFNQDASTDSEATYILKRAVAINDLKDEKYICFLPTESTVSSNVYTNTNYLIVVNDYSHNTQEADKVNIWLKWRYANANPAGGFAFCSGELFFCERRYSTYNTSVDHNVCKRLNDGLNTDYLDNHLPVSFEYKTAWYFNGDPSVFKKYNKIKIFSVPESASDGTLLTLNTERDFTDGFTQNTLTLDLSGPGGGYGVSAYGTSPYGNITQPNVKSKLNGKFKSIRLLFTNSQLQKNVEIAGWELEFEAPYAAKIKE